MMQSKSPVTRWCNNLNLAGKQPVRIKLPLTQIQSLCKVPGFAQRVTNAVTSITVTKMKIVRYHSYIRVSDKKQKQKKLKVHQFSICCARTKYLRYIKARLKYFMPNTKFI